MAQRERGPVTVVVIILLGGVVFSAANLLVLLMEVKGSIEISLAGELYRLCPPCVFYFAAAPIIVAALNSIMVWEAGARRRGSATGKTEAQQPTAPTAEPALQLLALLQQEGRFVDFLQEEIEPYSDAQIGSAMRAIHSGCRKALRDRVQFQRVIEGEDGSQVTVAVGFDPAAIRLTGNVSGEPPFKGTLQHGGWRATKVALPQSIGTKDATIIAAAEVEIG